MNNTFKKSRWKTEYLTKLHNEWLLGRITKTVPGRDRKVRVADKIMSIAGKSPISP